MAISKQSPSKAATPSKLPAGRETEAGPRRKAIDLAVSTIEKQFGKGSILTMTEDAVNREIEAIPSGSPSSGNRIGPYESGPPRIVSDGRFMVRGWPPFVTSTRRGLFTPIESN